MTDSKRLTFNLNGGENIYTAKPDTLFNNGVLALRRIPIDVMQVNVAFQNRKLPSIPDYITLHAEYHHTKKVV